MAAAVPQDHHPRLRLAVAPPAMPWRAAAARRADPRGAQHALNGGARERHPFHRTQLLGEVLVVESLVLLTAELDQARPQRRRHAVGRGAPLIAVHDARGSPLLDGAPQPPYLPR